MAYIDNNYSLRNLCHHNDKGFRWFYPAVAIAGRDHRLQYLFYGLSQVVKVMNLGVTYAIWSGLGICLVSLLSWLVFKQKLDLPAILGMLMIIIGVMIIQLFSKAASH